MKKFIALFLLLCFSTVVNVNAITIAVIPKGLDNPVFEPARIAAEKEAKKLGVTLLWTGSEVSDTQKQIEAIEKVMKDPDVKGIAISANHASALNEVIAKAVKKGIVVTTWDSDTVGSKRLFYIGTDNFRVGEMCGKEMQAMLGKGKRVMALSGNPDALNLSAREKGFISGLKGSDITIAGTLYCYDNVKESAKLIEMYTQKMGDTFDAWYFVGGWPLFSENDAMKSLKAFKGKVVCFDYFPQGGHLLADGSIDICLAQNFGNMGRFSVRYLVDVIKNGKKYPEINDSGYYTMSADVYKVLPKDFESMMADIEEPEDVNNLILK